MNQLYRAASSGDFSFFKNLTEVDLLHVTTENNTVLHIAVQCDHLQVAEKIVKLCPKLLNQINSNDNTPLHVAAMVGNISMVSLLINHTKNLDIENGVQKILRMVNAVGDTALHIAVRYGKSKAVREIIKEDPGLAMIRNNFGDSALFLAVDRKLDKIAYNILRASAADCSYAGRDGMNVLHALVIRTRLFQVDWIGLLLEFGNICKKYLSFWVQLYFPPGLEIFFPILERNERIRFTAIQEDFVKEVIEKCPYEIMKVVDDSGWTPFHIAAHLGNEKVVDLFLKYDNSLAYMKDKDGLSALHIAAKEGSLNVISKLITTCPDIIEFMDKKGRTALHYAAERGQRRAVKLFLGIPGLVGLINEQDQEGNTPMHLAAIKGHHLVLILLVAQREVDIDAMNKEGLTTMDIVLSSTRITTTTKGYIMEMSRIEYGRLSLRGVLLNNHIPNMTLNTLRKLGVQERSRKESAAGDAGNATTMDEERKQANDKRQTNVLVATLIATVSFAAAFTVPGGYESNDVNKGLAVLSEKIAFKAFAIANSMAFSLSTAAVYTHFTASARSSSLTEENMLTIRACGFTSWALIALMIAFISGTYVVLPHSLAVTTAVVLCCFYFSGMVAVVV